MASSTKGLTRRGVRDYREHIEGWTVDYIRSTPPKSWNGGWTAQVWRKGRTILYAFEVTRLSTARHLAREAVMAEVTRGLVRNGLGDYRNPDNFLPAFSERDWREPQERWHWRVAGGQYGYAPTLTEARAAARKALEERDDA